MSTNAPDWFRPQYESRVQHIYQTEGWRLQKAVTPATSFNDSNEAVFYIAGKTVARKIDRNTAPVPGGGDRKKFTAPLVTWQAFDELRQYDLDRLAINEREIIYHSGALALGRATDVEIYDTMKTAAPTVDAGLDFSAGAFTAAQAMTLTKVIVASKAPFDGQIYCGLPEDAWFQFLANKVVNSSDHVGPGALPFNQPTDSRFWNGVNWFLLVEENADDFYYTHDTTKRDAFIWHKSAMGWGAKDGTLTMIPQWNNYGEGGGCWSFNMQAKGAATTLQEGRAIKRFTLSNNAAIAIV
jgi:hypothetical protein